MTIDNNREVHEESCVIVAEIDGVSHRFNVAIPDILNGINTIKAAYKYLDKECTRVYVSGFALVSKNTNLTKDALISRVTSSVRLANAQELQGSLSFK